MMKPGDRVTLHHTVAQKRMSGVQGTLLAVGHDGRLLIFSSQTHKARWYEAKMAWPTQAVIRGKYG